MTGSRHVATVDGEEYIDKNDGWSPEGQIPTHILLQEWVCARLASTIGVPIPEFSLLQLNGDVCFGSRMLPLASPRFARAWMQRIANPEALYQIAVFDAWVFNRDRHEGNLVVALHRSSFHLVAIDHSHCPLYSVEGFDALRHHRDELAVGAVQAYIRVLLDERVSLARSVHQVQNMSDDTLRSLTQPPPGIRCSPAEHALLVDYLAHRRDTLRDLFNGCRDAFPALRELPL